MMKRLILDDALGALSRRGRLTSRESSPGNIQGRSRVLRQTAFGSYWSTSSSLL